MKSNVETLNSVQKKLEVQIGAELVNREFDKAFKRVQQKAHIKGFRPGKAPLSMIKKLYEHNVKAEVGEQLIRNYLNEALNKHEVKAVAWPMIDVKEAPDFDKEFVFNAIVDIMPDLQLKDYKGFSITCEEYQVTDQRIDRELQALRRRHSKTQDLPAEAVAASGKE